MVSFFVCFKVIVTLGVTKTCKNAWQTTCILQGWASVLYNCLQKFPANVSSVKDHHFAPPVQAICKQELFCVVAFFYLICHIQVAVSEKCSFQGEVSV